MKRLIVLSIALLLSASSGLMAQWTKVNTIDGGNLSGIYAANGNLYACSYHDGFYVSTDTGSTWILKNNTFPSDTTCFVVDGQNVIAGNVNGIYLSNDDGASWYFSNSGLPSNPKIFCLVKDVSGIYAGTVNGVYLSTNSGAAWTPLNSGMTLPVRAIAIDGTYRYAAADTDVYVSNGGAWTMSAWSNTYRILSLYARSNGLYVSTKSGLYYSYNHGTSLSYVNYMDPVSFYYYNNTLFASAVGDIYYSTNGGGQWLSSHVGAGLNTGITSLGNALVISSYSGCFRSTNNGVNWSRSISGMQNPVVSNLMSDGTKIYAYNGSNLSNSANGGITWNLLHNAKITSIAHDNDTLYIVDYMSPFNLLKSTNNGSSWDTVTNMTGSVFVKGTDIFIGTFGLWTSWWDEYGYVYKSVNSTITWPSVFFVLSDVLNFSAFGTTLYASLNPGVAGSTDDGNTWTTVTGNLPVIQYRNSEHALLALNSTDVLAGSDEGFGIYKSTVNGTTWFPANSGLPNQPSGSGTYCNINDMINVGGAIFAGTTMGVYISTNQGSTWIGYNNGFNCAISVLSLMYDSLNTGFIYAGTEGEGLWKIPAPVLAVNDNNYEKINSSIYPDPVRGNSVIRYFVPKKSDVTLKIFDVTGVERDVLVNGQQTEGVHYAKFNSSALAPGVYFYSITCGNDTESRRFVILR